MSEDLLPLLLLLFIRFERICTLCFHGFISQSAFRFKFDNELDQEVDNETLCYYHREFFHVPFNGSFMQCSGSSQKLFR